MCWYGLIPVYRGLDLVAFTKVDARDYGEQVSYRWGLNQKGYVRRGQRVQGAYRTYLLSREILGVEDSSVQVDHKNRCPLDNRRENLRLTDDGGNRQNETKRVLYRGRKPTSRFKGVSLDRRNGRWRVHVRVEGKKHFFGSFASEEEAGRVAEAARKEHQPMAVD